MLRWLLARIPEQEVGSHLLTGEGEQVIDLVRHHWFAYVKATAISFGGFLVLLFGFFGPINLGWFFFLAGLGIMSWGAYLALGEHRDVFVVTNMRVFRASGVFSVRIATMPISRILDITVEKPFIGRILGFGHFVFESAAQAQGLRDIRFIGNPDQRDLTIQRVIQRSGLRPNTSP
ncbi:MAG: rane-flanked domain protein [Nocardioidaceae bacterium]|nr:rane-flanked domain protein [Nocardioidaceae bacterium]